jgi:hypothetical protein
MCSIIIIDGDYIDLESIILSDKSGHSIPIISRSRDSKGYIKLIDHSGQAHLYISGSYAGKGGALKSYIKGI